MSHTQSRAGGYQRAGRQTPILVERAGEGGRRAPSPLSQAFSRAAGMSGAGKAWARSPREAGVRACSGSSSQPAQAALGEQRAHSAEPPPHRTPGRHGRAGEREGGLGPEPALGEAQGQALVPCRPQSPTQAPHRPHMGPRAPHRPHMGPTAPHGPHTGPKPHAGTT